MVMLGVTVTVAITGAAVPLVAVKAAILPLPLAAKPIDGVLFTQLNTLPGVAVVKFTGAVDAVLHTTWLPGWVTSAEQGFTVMVPFAVAIPQPPVKVTV